MKVLIVDDDSNIHLECEMILSEFGIESILTARNLQDAIKQLQFSNPDVILLDVFLGTENGLELLNLAQESDIPTIVITGNPQEKLTHLSNWSIVKSFITKPINPIKLKYEVKRVADYLNDKESNSYLYYKGSNKIERIRYHEILFLETEGNYTTFVTRNKKHVLKKSLKQVNSHLSPKIFCQIFRNIVVNINHIKRVDFSKNIVFLDHDFSFSLGLKYKNTLKAIIKKEFDIL